MTKKIYIPRDDISRDDIDIYTQIEQQNGKPFAQAIREYDDRIFKIPGIVDMLEYAGQEATEPLIEYLHRFRVENCPILKQKSYITKGFIRIRDQEGKDRIIHYHREERGYYIGPKCYVKDGVLSKVNPDSEILLEHFVLNLEDGTVKDVYDTLGDHVKNVPPNDAFRELLENTINGKKIKIREDKDGVQHLLADDQEVLTMKDEHLLSMNIPDGVTEIWPDTFAYFRHLQSVHLSDTVTLISLDAFSHCRSLKSIDIRRVREILVSIPLRNLTIICHNKEQEKMIRESGFFEGKVQIAPILRCDHDLTITCSNEEQRKMIRESGFDITHPLLVSSQPKIDADPNQPNV